VSSYLDHEPFLYTYITIPYTYITIPAISPRMADYDSAAEDPESRATGAARFQSPTF
jgi:hypothetical protein